jgi:hypothetical protein
LFRGLSSHGGNAIFPQSPHPRNRQIGRKAKEIKKVKEVEEAEITKNPVARDERRVKSGIRGAFPYALLEHNFG